MGDTDRRARADLIARRLAAAVGRKVPAGIGRSEDAQMAVEIPDRKFTNALALFEKGLVEEAEVVKAGQKLLAAWERAAAEFHNDGG